MKRKLQNNTKSLISVSQVLEEERVKKKIKLSGILRGMTRSDETKQRIKKNHSRSLAKEVKMYKAGVFIKSFSTSREAGIYASSNGIRSFGWCGRSLKTGELTKSTNEYPALFTANQEFISKTLSLSSYKQSVNLFIFYLKKA